MWKRIVGGAVALGLGAGLTVAADNDTEPAWLKLAVTPPPEAPAVEHELTLTETVVGGSDIHRGPTSYGQLSENHLDFSYVAGVPLREGWQLRAGVAYERYDFGSLRGAVLPNRLGVAALVLGLDVNLSEQWLLRVEVRPGVYGEFSRVTMDQVNVPLILGATYLVNADWQWFLGVQVDPHFGTGIYHWDDVPVMPGAGLRWRFADRWTLLAMLPNPEVQYEVMDGLQVYVGARMNGGNFRTDKNSGRGKLANANLSYYEIRVGAGARYALAPGLSLEAEGGSAVTRQFYYSGADMQFHTDPAWYAQVRFSMEF
jgi:opacity protein-like surface antigen